MPESKLIATSTLAIEIDSETTWELLCDLNPIFRNLSYADNLGNFLIPNWKGDGPTLINPQTVPEYFDHIEPAKKRIKLVELISTP